VLNAAARLPVRSYPEKFAEALGQVALREMSSHAAAQSDAPDEAWELLFKAPIHDFWEDAEMPAVIKYLQKGKRLVLPAGWPQRVLRATM
jgi:hypothetical protein